MAQEKKQTDLQKVKELIELMIANDLVEIEIIDGETKIHLKRPGPQPPVVTPVPMVAPPAAAGGPAAAEPTPPTEPEEKKAEEELIEIKSQIVGTFYTAPSPDSDPYVQVGSEVNPDTVVCIIEAMKVMNEIKAEVSGIIARILVANGQAVEYDQVLFKVKPF